MVEIIFDWATLGNDVLSIFKSQATNSRAVLDVMHIIFNDIFLFFLVIATVVSLIYVILSLKVIFSKDDDKEKKFILEKAPTVTIQIPTRNEVIALRCARKCLEFDYPAGKFNILIGDDSDDSSVSKELDEFAAKYDNVRVIRRKENIGFKPGNLNNLLKYTKGEIIVLFDSDFAPEKDFLKRIVTPFIYDKEQKISATQARWEFINTDENLVTVLAATIVYVFHHIFLPLMKRNNTGTLCGSAEAVRKSHLVECGGWVSGSLTEDIEYSLRIHQRGRRIEYIPDLLCNNEVPSKLPDLYKQQMRWAYGVITSYKMHGKALLTTKNLNWKQKSLAFLGGFGYLIPVLILLLTGFGLLSVVTNAPAPIDIPRFLAETSKNILLTFGLVIASMVSLHRAGKLRLAGKMVVASFSVGLVTTYYVNKGIFKALLNKPMKWYLLKKSTDYMKG